MTQPSIGIWLIGAKGGVATTAIVGLAALKRGLTGAAGLVSQLPRFAGLKLAAWDDFLVGGHEIRDVCLADEALRLATESRVLGPALIDQCRDELEATDGRVCPGILHGVGSTIEQLAGPDTARGETPRAAVRRVRDDLEAFVRRHKLERLVVVNVASTEPPVDRSSLPARWAELEPLLDREDCPLPASALYAIAALDAGHAYVNFTPSLGSAPAAIGELARLRGTCHMGCDGKTGETLMKSVLAPMFAQRNLQVMSWVGHNIFGNLDGKVLNDPVNKKAKVASKDRLLGEILGYKPQTLVSIEYIEGMGDWKTAWDHVHFRGFLGTPMTLQFVWEGCDSLLAAPLVLDLVRFTDLARRRGQTGTLTFLASFFKSPYEVAEHGFLRQFQMLQEWAEAATY